MTTTVAAVMIRGGTLVVPAVVDHKGEVVPADLAVDVAEAAVAVADLAVGQEVGKTFLPLFIFRRKQNVFIRRLEK